MEVVIIIISGVTRVGKTSFIESFAEYEIISTGPQPISNRDLGRITVSNNLVVYLISVTLENRFNAYVSEHDALYAKVGLSVFIMLIDSTRPETFAPSRAMIEKFNHKNPYAPIVVIATKRDLDNSLEADTIRDLLGLPSEIECVDGQHKARDYNMNLVMRLFMQSAKIGQLYQTKGLRKETLNFIERDLSQFTPVSPVEIPTQFDMSQIKIRRLNPKHNAEIMAGFINNFLDKEQHYSKETMYYSFGQYGYLWVRVGDTVLAVAQFQIVNFMCELHLYAKPEMEVVIYLLLQVIHQTCLEIETAMIAIPRYEHLRTLLERQNYQYTERVSLPDSAWLDIYERLDIQSAMTYDLIEDAVKDIKKA